MFTARKMAKAFFVNSGSEANDTQVCQIIIPVTVSFSLEIFI